MKLEHKHKRWIILGIAAAFIFYGLLDMVFKFNINPKTVNNVGMLLMIAAFGLLFSGKKPKQNSSNETATNSSIQDNTTQLETKDNEQDNKSEVENKAQIETNRSIQDITSETETSNQSQDNMDET